MRVHEPPARGDTGGASAHKENLGIAAGHLDMVARTRQRIAQQPAHYQLVIHQ